MHDIDMTDRINQLKIIDHRAWDIIEDLFGDVDVAINDYAQGYMATDPLIESLIQIGIEQRIVEQKKNNKQLCFNLKYDMSIAYMHGNCDKEYIYMSEIYWRPGQVLDFGYGDTAAEALLDGYIRFLTRNLGRRD